MALVAISDDECLYERLPFVQVFACSDIGRMDWTCCAKTDAKEGYFDQSLEVLTRMKSLA
jgi:hypothetical protein